MDALNGTALYGGGHARMYVRGASFYILRDVGVLPPMEGLVEWHHPCMGVVMPGCMSWHAFYILRDVRVLPWKDALKGTTPYGVVMPGCMSVARRSTSYAMSVSFHPWKDALNGTTPVWGWSCPDVCPWHVVYIYAMSVSFPPMEGRVDGTAPVWGRLSPMYVVARRSTSFATLFSIGMSYPGVIPWCHLG